MRKRNNTLPFGASRPSVSSDAPLRPVRTTGIDPELFTVKREPVKASQRALLFAGAGLALGLGLTLTVVNQGGGGQNQRVATAPAASSSSSGTETSTSAGTPAASPAPVNGPVVTPLASAPTPIVTPGSSAQPGSSGASSAPSTPTASAPVGSVSPDAPESSDPVPAPAPSVVETPSTVAPTPTVKPSPTVTTVAPPATTIGDRNQLYTALGAGSVKVKINGNRISADVITPASGWRAEVLSRPTDNDLVVIFYGQTKNVRFTAKLLNGDFIDVSTVSEPLPTTTTAAPTTVRSHSDDLTTTHADPSAPALASSTVATA